MTDASIDQPATSRAPVWARDAGGSASASLASGSFARRAAQAVGPVLLIALCLVMALAAWRLTRGVTPWALGLGALAFMRPSWGMATFLTMLPIFGNKPATPQIWTLVLFGSTLHIGLALRALLRPPAAWTAGGGSGGAIPLLLTLYGVASVLSLSSLPLVEIWHEARASIVNPADPLAYVVTLLRVQDNEPAYSLYTVVLTLQALAFAVFVRRETRGAPQTGVLFAKAILIGLVASFVVGLLDFYQLLDLRPLRSLDPVVNPHNIQARLQSTFGHSGWFAEFVTMAVPYCMVILLSPMRYGWRIAAILLCMLVGELTLILTYQRGGWLSYPFVLFAIWLSIYHLAARDAERKTLVQTLRQSFVKIAISLPATVLVSLLLAYAFAQVGWLVPNRDLGLSRYADRAAQLTKASDRLPYIIAGFRLGTLHPVLGAGSESFGFTYFDEFVRPGGAFYDNGRHPLGVMYGSAHNVYAQTFAGKGAVGLALLVALMAVVLIGGPRLLFTRNDLSTERRLLLLMTIASTFAFAAYGLVQEVFYIPSLQYLVFATFGLCAAAADPWLRVGARIRRALWIGLVCAAMLHVAVEYGYPGRTRERNFWQDASRRGWTLGMSEVDRTGARFWWTGARAVFEVPRDARFLTLPLRSAAPSTQSVRILLDGVMVDEVKLTDHAWRNLRYPLPAAARFTRAHRIELQVDPTWQAPGDGRHLGVMVGPYAGTP